MFQLFSVVQLAQSTDILITEDLLVSNDQGSHGVLKKFIITSK